MVSVTEPGPSGSGTGTGLQGSDSGTGIGDGYGSTLEHDVSSSAITIESQGVCCVSSGRNVDICVDDTV